MPFQIPVTVGKAVLFQHRGTHWWAAPLYQKQRNRSGLNNWLVCLASWYMSNFNLCILLEADHSRKHSKWLKLDVEERRLWGKTRQFFFQKKRDLNGFRACLLWPFKRLWKKTRKASVSVPDIFTIIFVLPKFCFQITWWSAQVLDSLQYTAAIYWDRETLPSYRNQPLN